MRRQGRTKPKLRNGAQREKNRAEKKEHNQVLISSSGPWIKPHLKLDLLRVWTALKESGPAPCSDKDSEAGPARAERRHSVEGLREGLLTNTPQGSHLASSAPDNMLLQYLLASGLDSGHASRTMAKPAFKEATVSLGEMTLTHMGNKKL